MLILLISMYNSVAQNTTEKKIVYLFPGQGSDHRAFKNFNVENCDTLCIKYMEPFRRETMAEYAQRLSSQIDTSRRYSFVGVSLGGMFSVELSKILKPEEVIIISSAKCRKELPHRYRFMRILPLYKIFGARLMLKSTFIVQPIVEPDSRKVRETCKAMLKDKNPKFLKRTIQMIVKWENKDCDSSIVHIHGTKDNTISYKRIKNPITIEDGSHMMIMTRTKEIIKIVNAKIKP